MENNASNTKQSLRVIGYLLVALAAFCYSWQSPITKLLLAEGVRALDVVTGLSLCGAVLIDGYLLAAGKASEVIKDAGAHLPVVFFQGVAKFCVNYGLFLGLRTMPAGVLSVVFYTSPALVCLFFMITKIKPVGRANRAAVVLTIGGCLLALDVFRTPLAELSVSGILLGLLAAAGSSTFTVLTDLKGRDMERKTIVAGALTVGALLSVIINPGIFLRIPSFSLVVFGLFIGQAIVTKILTIITETAGMIQIGSERAIVVLALEVPFTLLISYFVLRETMAPVQLCGVALVVGSVILLQKSK